MAKKRDQRQAEDRVIVAVDPIEQLDALALELIGADGTEDPVTDTREIAVEERWREGAHMHFGRGDGRESDPAGFRDSDAGMQMVDSASKRHQMVAGTGQILRLGIAPITKSKGLVGAYDSGARMKHRDGDGLGRGQRKRDLVGAGAACGQVGIKRAFVDIGGNRLDGKACASEQGHPRLGF